MEVPAWFVLAIIYVVAIALIPLWRSIGEKEIRLRNADSNAKTIIEATALVEKIETMEEIEWCGAPLPKPESAWLSAYRRKNRRRETADARKETIQ